MATKIRIAIIQTAARKSTITTRKKSTKSDSIVSVPLSSAIPVWVSMIPSSRIDPKAIRSRTILVNLMRTRHVGIAWIAALNPLN